MRNDKTSLIERLADAEQRLGVSFNALYAYTEGKWAHLNGEIDLRKATGNDLRVVANFYDLLGRMIETVEHYVEAVDDETFEAFSMLTDIDAENLPISRIRLYPKASG